MKVSLNKISLIILLMSSGVSQSIKSKNYGHLDELIGENNKLYQKEIFTGVAFDFYPGTESIRKEFEVVNGIKNGKYRELWKNGELKVVGEYLNGVKNNKWTVYNENYKLSSENYYRDGQDYNYTRFSYYNSGELKYKFYSEAGDCGECVVYETEYFKNSRKKSERIFDAGDYIDGFKEWYENGNLKREGTYEENKVHGLVSTWYPNGKKKMEREWYQGMIWAVKNDWDRDGTLRSLNAPYVHYYENGNKKEEGTYFNGNKDGVTIYYYPNGQKKEERYEYRGDGHKVIGEWNEDGTGRKQAIKIKICESSYSEGYFGTFFGIDEWYQEYIKPGDNVEVTIIYDGNYAPFSQNFKVQRISLPKNMDCSGVLYVHLDSDLVIKFAGDPVTVGSSAKFSGIPFKMNHLGDPFKPFED